MTGASALDDVRAWWARFVKTNQDADLDRLALWTAHTHVLDRVRTTPRLLVASPLPGAGKTTVLEHLAALCPAPVMASNALTAPVVARLAGQGRTILIDEADKHIGSGSADQRALLGIVNAGYKVGGCYVVNEQRPDGTWCPAELPVYAPVAMAGLSPKLPDDTSSRTITVFLMPDRFGTVEETDWEVIEDEATELRTMLATWAETADLTGPGTLPVEVGGRLREVWRPLKRVADSVGGSWPKVVDVLAMDHAAQIRADVEDGLHEERPSVALVRDLWTVWPDADDTGQPLTFAPTAVLLSRLGLHAPERWGNRQTDGRTPLTPHRMGHMLRKFDIRPGHSDDRQMRGYRHRQFHEVWSVIGVTESGEVIAERIA